MGTAATARKSPPGCRAQLVLQPLGPLCLCPAEQQPSLKDKVAAAPQGGFVYSSIHPYLKTLDGSRAGSSTCASDRGEALIPEADLDASESATWDCAAAAPLPDPGWEGGIGLRPGWSSSAHTFHGAGAALRVWCIFMYVGLYISHVGF